MTRRNFIACIGGASAIVLLGAGAVVYSTLERAAVSFQASFLRLVLRWFVKVRDGHGPSIAALRRSINSIEWIIPGPAENTKTIQLDAGGVTAFRVTRPESRDGH